MPPFGELPLDGVVATFRATLDRSMGLDPSSRATAATTVTATDQLSGTGLVVVVAAARHRVVWCDPVVRDQFLDLTDRHRAPDVDALAAEVRRRGATEVGTSILHVVHRRGLRSVDLPGGAVVDRLPIEEAGRLLDELVASCSTEDVAEAGFDDPVDGCVTIVEDGEGQAIAAVIERPTRMAATFGDLGILVRPSARGRGWGAGAASRAARESFAAGRLPLYRCEARHGPSLRLAARLGFRRVGELWVSRFGAQTRTSSSDTSSGSDASR